MKTAVEWLEKAIALYVERCDLHEEFEQAKEMEKEQIIEAYCKGCADIIKDENIFPRETSEQYYNETFKSE
jgi:hypothetical protein